VIIKEPGLYEITDDQYFSDPCPQPSLTQSIAKILLSRSPMHAAHAHPRINPHYVADDDKKFDLGNICHAHLMGRGRDFHLVDADDWRTKAAQEERKRAIARGQLPVLRKVMVQGLAMHHAVTEAISECSIGWQVPTGVKSEATMIWRERGDLMESGPRRRSNKKQKHIWLRTKMDRVVFSGNRVTVYDYKTTAMSAAESDVGHRLYDSGWDIQAAMHSRGLVALHPLMAGCTKHIFIVQETKPPYACNLFELPESVLTGGRLRLQKAVTIWSDCIKRNEWPGYTKEVRPIFYPDWTLKRLEAEGFATEAVLEAAE
jgi:PDDEXK-like domain of unknown function (DUF3799)